MARRVLVALPKRLRQWCGIPGPHRHAQLAMRIATPDLARHLDGWKDALMATVAAFSCGGSCGRSIPDRSRIRHRLGRTGPLPGIVEQLTANASYEYAGQRGLGASAGIATSSPALFAGGTREFSGESGVLCHLSGGTGGISCSGTRASGMESSRLAGDLHRRVDPSAQALQRGLSRLPLVRPARAADCRLWRQRSKPQAQRALVSQGRTVCSRRPARSAACKKP